MTAAVPQAVGSVRLAEPRGRWVLAAAVLGSSMVMLDGTVVNVALPTIGKDLQTLTGRPAWTVTAYTLTLAGLILLGGSLGDRLGRRRVFLAGVVWFALASALCGLSPRHRGAHRRPGAAGSRRRAAHARLAGHYPGHVPGQRPAAGGRRLVGPGRGRRRRRPVPGRLDRRRPRLALDLPAQPAAGGGGGRGGGAARAGEQGSHGQRPVRRGRCGAGGAGPRRHHRTRSSRPRRTALPTPPSPGRWVWPPGPRSCCWNAGGDARGRGPHPCCRWASSPPGSSPRSTW